MQEFLHYAARDSRLDVNLSSTPNNERRKVNSKRSDGQTIAKRFTQSAEVYIS